MQSLFKKFTGLALAFVLAFASFGHAPEIRTNVQLAPSLHSGYEINFLKSADAATGYSTTLRNARLDAITTAVGNAGVLTIYSGTQPATCGTATTVLVNFTLGTPFAPAASAAVLSPTLPSATAAAATGTASWARVKTSGGTCVIDMPVGTSGTPMILNSLSITSGVNVTVTSWSITTGNS